MDEFGDRLNAILNDPNALSRITDMAKSMFGGEKKDGPAPESAPSGDAGLDPDMLGKLASIMRKSSDSGSKRALLEAMKPYLSEERREKMDKAFKIAKLAGMASAAASELGLGKDREESDV